MTSSGWDLLNSNSGPTVVCPSLHQFHVSSPPLMLFGGYLPRNLDTSCIHECVTSLDLESSHAGHPGVLPISDQKGPILSAFAYTP